MKKLTTVLTRVLFLGAFYPVSLLTAAPCGFRLAPCFQVPKIPVSQSNTQLSAPKGISYTANSRAFLVGALLQQARCASAYNAQRKLPAYCFYHIPAVFRVPTSFQTVNSLNPLIQASIYAVSRPSLPTTSPQRILSSVPQKPLAAPRKQPQAKKGNPRHKELSTRRNSRINEHSKQLVETVSTLLTSPKTENISLYDSFADYKPVKTKHSSKKRTKKSAHMLQRIDQEKPLILSDQPISQKHTALLTKQEHDAYSGIEQACPAETTLTLQKPTSFTPLFPSQRVKRPTIVAQPQPLLSELPVSTREEPHLLRSELPAPTKEEQSPQTATLNEHVSHEKRGLLAELPEVTPQNNDHLPVQALSELLEQKLAIQQHNDHSPLQALLLSLEQKIEQEEHPTEPEKAREPVPVHEEPVSISLGSQPFKPIYPSRRVQIPRRHAVVPKLSASSVEEEKAVVPSSLPISTEVDKKEQTISLEQQDQRLLPEIPVTNDTHALVIPEQEAIGLRAQASAQAQADQVTPKDTIETHPDTVLAVPEKLRVKKTRIELDEQGIPTFIHNHQRFMPTQEGFAEALPSLDQKIFALWGQDAQHFTQEQKALICTCIQLAVRTSNYLAQTKATELCLMINNLYNQEELQELEKNFQYETEDESSTDTVKQHDNNRNICILM